LECVQNLIRLCIASICNKKVSSAQLSQEEDCLKRVNCSRILYASEPIEKDEHLTCFAEHAVSISAFLDTQESFQEAKMMKDMCGGDF